MTLHIRVLAAALLLGLIAAVGAATTADAMPKPGFLPGTWIGTASISGSATDGPMHVKFSGRFTFSLTVSKKLAVSGRGHWALTMVGSEDAPARYAVNSNTVGSAAVAIKGTSTNVIYAGKQHIEREITMAGKTTQLPPIEADLKGRLPITKATTCKVSGGWQIQPGVTLTWSAKRKGSC
jgi:hypothetical protein